MKGSLCGLDDKTLTVNCIIAVILLLLFFINTLKCKKKINYIVAVGPNP